jgi:hypothetical protein
LENSFIDCGLCAWLEQILNLVINGCLIMSLLTWSIEHGLEQRKQRVISNLAFDGIWAGFRSGIHESYGLGQDAVFGLGVAAAIFSPIDEAAYATTLAMGPAFGWSMSSMSNRGIFYDPRSIDPYSFGIDPSTVPRSSIRRSRRSGGPVEAKISRGTKSSSPGATVHPFWSSGKPKCKKGFRYDFKRKLCVKIK